MATRKKLIYTRTAPEGLFYMPRFISHQEEQQLISEIANQNFQPYDHHGYKAHREVVYFGSAARGYTDVATTSATIIETMPEWLLDLRDRFAHIMGLEENELAMALLARYAPGAGIGWHRDRPQFGPTVMGLSLQSDAEMRFRQISNNTEEMFKINLERGSAYLMSGPARSEWQHGMKPVTALRYSITFRTLKSKLDASDPRHNPANIAARLAKSNIYTSSSSDGYGETQSEHQPQQLRLF